MAEPGSSEAPPAADPHPQTVPAAEPLPAAQLVMAAALAWLVPGLGHVCAGDVAMATAHGGEWLTKFPRGLAVLE